MRSISRLLSFSVLSLGLLAPIAFAQPNETQVVQPKQRAGTPEQQVKEDITSFIRELKTATNFFGPQRYVADAKVGYFGANEWFKLWVKQRDIIQVTINEITIGKIENGATTAVVNLKWNQAYINDEGKQDTRTTSFNQNINLRLGSRRAGGNQLWQIVPPAQLPKDDVIEPPLLLGIPYVLAQRDWVYPETTLPSSIGRLKQLALCVLQFTQDYDDRYAFAPKYMQEALAPYTKSPEIFEIPNTNATYTFNGNLSDKPVAHIAIPSKTVLFYEGENEQPIFRYNDKAAIGFADGHCVLVSREEAKDMIWKP